MSKKIFQSQVLTRGAENGIWVTFGPTTTPKLFPDLFFDSTYLSSGCLLRGVLYVQIQANHFPNKVMGIRRSALGLFLLSFSQLLHKTLIKCQNLLNMSNLLNVLNSVPNVSNSIEHTKSTECTIVWTPPNVKLYVELTAECAITYTKVILCTQSELQVLNQHPLTCTSIACAWLF